MPSAAPEIDQLVRAYLTAKRQVVDGGYAQEVAWQHSAAREPVTPRLFVREAAWVVLSAGMSEAVVRGVFPQVTAACGGFNLAWMRDNHAVARAGCLAAFGHERKVDAIFDIGRTADQLGPVGLVGVLDDPRQFLMSLPYVGAVTWRHLAKNLGMPVAKADRHMVRLAAAAGRDSVDILCEEISAWLGEPVAVVDIVLWRWSVLHAAHCKRQCNGLPHLSG